MGLFIFAYAGLLLSSAQIMIGAYKKYNKAAAAAWLLCALVIVWNIAYV